MPLATKEGVIATIKTDKKLREGLRNGTIMMTDVKKALGLVFDAGIEVVNGVSKISLKSRKTLRRIKKTVEAAVIEGTGIPQLKRVTQKLRKTKPKTIQGLLKVLKKDEKKDEKKGDKKGEKKDEEKDSTNESDDKNVEEDGEVYYKNVTKVVVIPAVIQQGVVD